MYSIISHTYIKNGTSILIGDPAVCEFNNQLVAISNINKKFIRINELLEGGYYAYHTSGSNTPTFADNLVFLHESLQPEECLLEKEIGNLCTSLSGTVFICEEDKAFRSEYCYFVLEEEALYDIDELQSHIKQKDTLNAVDNSLLELCELYKNEKYVTGETILDITGSAYVPPFLRNILSTHWSADIARKLSDIPAAPIIGGVVSNAGIGFLKVYVLYHKKHIVGIRINLSAKEDLS